MQYTPQQLAGGVKFNNKVRIGNWKEDIELEEQKLKDFEIRRSRGELLLTKTSNKLSVACQSVPHTFSADGCIRFGDSIVLEHDIGAIACNITDSFNTQGDSMASIIPTSQAIARNTFQILKPSSSKSKDDILRFGDSFLIASNPSLSICPKTGFVKSPSYLCSELKSGMRQARLSMKQEVCFARKESFNTLWIAQPLNPDAKLRLEGTPVPANQTVLIFHQATNSPLAAKNNFSFKTEFGAEYELYSEKISGLKKVHALASEKLGVRAADMVEAPRQHENYFRFSTSASESEGVDNRDLHTMTIQTMFDLVKATISSKGINCYRGLSKVLKMLDNRKENLLAREEFKYGLREYGISLDKEEFDLLVSAFDKNRDGAVSYPSFISSLRGLPSEGRNAIIAAAYSSLSNNGSKNVTLNDIEKGYDARNHPSVLNGSRTDKDVFVEFVSGWDTQKKDGIVSFAEFYEYYTDISAAVDDDESFRILLTNAWHL